MIPEMNTLAKHNEYSFMKDRARAYTAKVILEVMKDKKQLRLLEPHHWPPNSPDLNLVDFGIWELLGQNVYRGQ